MGPRGRSKRKLHSESGTSVGGDSEDIDESASTTSRPRRNRVPKRYLDDDYSPPPTKRRAGNRETPSDAGDEEDDLKIGALRAAQQTSKFNVATPATIRSSKARGRPKKNPTPPRRKSQKQRQEEDVIYMDEDSDEDEESSDDEFIMNEEQKEELDDVDEILNFSDIKPNIEEDTFCPWVENPDSLPKLDLPETSQDIPIPIHATMDAIEIYEILRSYHRTLRITPFTFEDFCAALISKNNSCIIAEVHMALLRVCLKSDDEELTQYSVTETNNSVNIMIHHMDTLTFAEILRQYIEAYPINDSFVREAVNVENYPYVGYEPKIIVLLFLSYRFLYSTEFKKVVNNMGRFQNDENCRVCGKSSGKVVGCTQCEASYHVDCSHLKPFPEILICNICKKNSVRGVLPHDESVEKEPLRSQPIGRDRYGRFYWFICRRIIVQSLDEVEIHYYSTPPQLYQLLQKLDRHYYEKDLCEAIRLRIDEFLEQMTLTVEMTAERREAAVDTAMKKSLIGYEFAEATTSPIYLHKDSMKRMAAILRDCSEKTIKEEPSDSHDPEDEDATRLSVPLGEPIKYEEDSILPESMLGIFNGSLINTFWSGGASQEELVQLLLQSPSIDPHSLWRMGDEGNDQTFMQYYNYYMRNEMAESFLARKKAADKKKYMASKFSTIEQFEWVVAKDRQFYGSSVLHNKFVGWTLSKIARKIPTDLMHRKWIEVSKGFDIEVSVADDFKKLAQCLLQLDAVTRKTIYVQQWWSGLGQTKLERITVDQRESFVKDQQRIKKLEADALAKDLDDSFVKVNYSKPKWPNTYILRQKGETYRNAGKGMMGGWAWVAKKYTENWVNVPNKPTLPLDGGMQETKNETSSNAKARRLDLLVTKLLRKRDSRVSSSNISTFELTNRCYSPLCRNSTGATVTNSKCYSSSCRDGLLVEARERHIEEVEMTKRVFGEEKPWPIPEVQTFKTSRGGKSIFVLQKRVLRQMIKTAGCQQVYIPGFSAGMKSNLLIWPYTAPRPTLDLCWKWQTLNSRSLHSVALQLKIMWSSIKWNEFEPDDTHPDRRVVIDTPSHDERRRIIRHKEMPPYGQYERYELEIEIIPLYDEQEEEDDSWLSRNRSSDCSQRSSSNRKKRPQRIFENRQATAIRKEWVDGVTLKVFEIKDYWRWVRMEAEKIARKKIEAAKKLAKAKGDAERQRNMVLQKSLTVPRMPSIALERTNVPYMGSNRRSGVGLEPTGNGRYLEKFNNTSQFPPRTPSTYNSPQTGLAQRVQPNPIPRKVPVLSYATFNRSQSLQSQYMPRAVAGSDHMSNGHYRASLMTQDGVPSSSRQQHTYNAQQNLPQPARKIMNGQLNQNRVPRNLDGVRIIQQGTTVQIPQRRVVYTSFGEPITTMRSGLPVVEEALGVRSTRDGSEVLPPQIPRYDNPNPGFQIEQQPAQQMHSATSGTTRNVVYVKTNASGTQKMMIRKPVGSSNIHRQLECTPGTVLAGGQRFVSTRPISVQQNQQMRQIFTPSGTQRYVRVQNSGTPRPTDQFVRRVVHAGQPRHLGDVEQSQVRQQQLSPQSSEQPYIPQNPRFVIQGRSIPPNASSPRGGMTMQMVQQQQSPKDDYKLGEDQVIVHEEVIYDPAKEATEFDHFRIQKD